MCDKVFELLTKRIEELEARNQELEKCHEDARYEEEWRWRHIRRLSEEENLDLPVPRLELRHRMLSKYDRVVDYGLVTRHLLGDILFKPFGSTRVSGNLAESSSEPYIPFRDGCHIQHDMVQLKLPAFVVNGSVYAPIREK